MQNRTPLYRCCLAAIGLAMFLHGVAWETSSLQASLIDSGLLDKPVEVSEKLFPPEKRWETADEIQVFPLSGETIEILRIDEGAGIKYYKATAPGYERLGRADVHGSDYDIVSLAQKIYYDEETWKVHWTTENTIETILLTGAEHKILAQSNSYTPNALDWVWLNSEDAWMWDDTEQTWKFLLGNILLYNPDTQGWGDFHEADLTGWFWWGDYPWIYGNDTGTWYYLVGDSWTYSSTTEAWSRIENTDGIRFDGTVGASHLETTQDNIFFQLDPPQDSGKTAGSIQQLDLLNQTLSTAVELTNATSIANFPVKGEVYWSDTTGVYAAIPGTPQKRPLLLTSTPGSTPQPFYQEAAPTSPGSLYTIDISEDSPSNQYLTIDLMENNLYRMGYGKNFISGNYVYQKTGTHEAQITLTSQSPITAFQGDSLVALRANTVQEAYQLSAGAVNLPETLTINITYQDTQSGTTANTAQLASSATQVTTGQFTAEGGSYVGIPTYPTPNDRQGASVQAMEAREDDNELTIDLIESDGSSLQVIVNPGNVQATDDSDDDTPGLDLEDLAGLDLEDLEGLDLDGLDLSDLAPDFLEDLDSLEELLNLGIIELFQ